MVDKYTNWLTGWRPATYVACWRQRPSLCWGYHCKIFGFIVKHLLRCISYVQYIWSLQTMYIFLYKDIYCSPSLGTWRYPGVHFSHCVFFIQAIIIGVGHCGTRALLDFLTMHPHIVSSNKEIHFFDRDENFAKGYAWYKAQMPLSYSNQVWVVIYI